MKDYKGVLEKFKAFIFVSMATNAGAGAARQLQSARMATAVWKASRSVHPRGYKLIRAEVHSPVAWCMGANSESVCY